MIRIRTYRRKKVRSCKTARSLVSSIVWRCGLGSPSKIRYTLFSVCAMYLTVAIDYTIFAEQLKKCFKNTFVSLGLEKTHVFCWTFCMRIVRIWYEMEKVFFRKLGVHVFYYRRKFLLFTHNTCAKNVPKDMRPFTSQWKIYALYKSMKAHRGSSQ